MIARIAAGRFVVAALAGFCMILDAPNIVVTALVVISPGIWLFLERAMGAVEDFNSNAVAMSVAVGLAAIANAVLYGLVGAIVALLRRMLVRKQAIKS